MSNRIGIIAFFAGIVFAIGLGLSGMTDPGIVMGFMDVAGAWNPTLMFVMVGALLVYFTLSRATLSRNTPVVGPKFVLPTKSEIDARLIIGSSLFGVGWGLAGICPGPGITSLVTGAPHVAVFIATMAGGMYLNDVVNRVLAAHGAKAGAKAETEPMTEPRSESTISVLGNAATNSI